MFSKGKKARTSSTRNERRPEDIPQSIQPKLTLAALKNKSYIGHRTIDWGTIRTLGLQAQFDEVLTDDWKNFFAIRTPVYERICEEFFSTFRFNTKMGSTTESAMTFTIGGRAFTMSIAEFGIQMGLYTAEEVTKAEFKKSIVEWPVGYNVDRFWGEYNLGREARHNNTKQSAITNPAWRILLRVIAESISNRENCPNNATATDLFYLYCMLSHTRCNIARSLAHYLYKRGHGERKGAIAGGSFVCHLAFRLGVYDRADLDRRFGAIAHVHVIDMGALRNMKIVDANNNLIVPGEQQDDSDDEAEDVQGGQNPPTAPQQYEPFSMGAMARQLGIIEDSVRRIEDRQTSFFDVYKEDQRMIASQFDRVQYPQDFYQPYHHQWANREAESSGVPVPDYSPPDIYTPAHRTGSSYYPPPQYGGYSGAGPSEEPIFGTAYQGDSAPSIFSNYGDEDDMMQ